MSLLDAKTHRILEEIHAFTGDVLRDLRSRASVYAAFVGAPEPADRPERLQYLRALVDEHWSLIESALPEASKDLRHRPLWEGAFALHTTPKIRHKFIRWIYRGVTDVLAHHDAAKLAVADAGDERPDAESADERGRRHEDRLADLLPPCQSGAGKVTPVSHSPTQYKPDQLRRLLVELRADFDKLRERERPIKIRLIHEASNAEAEGGPHDEPPFGEQPVAFLSAGHRLFRQHFDANGKPRLTDPPVLNPAGEPIVDSAGRGLDVTMPARRLIQITGDSDAVTRLRGLAKRGGQLAGARPGAMLRMLDGWQFGASEDRPEDRWWALVFELAWSGRHPSLSAKRNLWWATETGGLVLVPYDAEELRVCAGASPESLRKHIPETWLTRLPEAYMSEIDDAASACFDLADALADELAATQPRYEVASETAEGVDLQADGAEEPDAKGYVKTPSDPRSYVPVTEIVTAHTPPGLSMTARRVSEIAEDYADNQIRWTRPRDKRGNPIKNRRSVHLGDWAAYVKTSTGIDAEGFPRLSEAEIDARKNAVRQTGQCGK